MSFRRASGASDGTVRGHRGIERKVGYWGGGSLLCFGEGIPLQGPAPIPDSEGIRRIICTRTGGGSLFGNDAPTIPNVLTGGIHVFRELIELLLNRLLLRLARLSSPHFSLLQI